MNLNDYFNQVENVKDSHGMGYTFMTRFKRIVCQDGFSLSVQANQLAYCTPRNNHGPYTKVEVGFPSAVPEGLWEYGENPENPTESVYGYVPIGLVEALIEQHGGFLKTEG